MTFARLGRLDTESVQDRDAFSNAVVDGKAQPIGDVIDSSSRFIKATERDFFFCLTASLGGAREIIKSHSERKIICRDRAALQRARQT